MSHANLADLIAAPVTYSDEQGYHQLFAELRRDHPVFWAEPAGYRPFWAISRHADIMEVEKQADIFVSAPRTALRSHQQEEAIKAVTGSYQAARTLIQMDGPQHRQFRALTQSWFLPKHLKTLESSMEALAVEFCERMERKGGACDFVTDVALWYPLRAVMTILGVPEQDEALMLRLTQQHFANTDPTIRRDVGGDAGSAVSQLFSYFDKLAVERRVAPRDDIVSLLTDATVDGQPISDFDRNSYVFIMAVAGHDTTSSSISGLLLALLQNPDQMARLRADRSLLATAVDEGVRWVSPVKHFFRTATRDYELRGQRIRAGDSLMMCYPSANRDEEVFQDPYDFRIDRKPNNHLAFGYGAHLCLGQHLAKLEMRAFFSRFLDRIEDVALDGPPEWLHANFVGGLKTLPVRYRVRQSEVA